MKRRHSLPAELYTLAERIPATVLLECASHQMAGNGWTRIFLSPLRTVSACTPEEVAPLLEELEKASAQGLTAAGFFTYECGLAFEPKACQVPPAPGEPLAWFGIYQRSYLFDHATGSFPEGEPPELTALRAEALSSPAGTVAVEQKFPMLAGEYQRKIEAIQDWIRDGDIYQLNYTFPLELGTEGSLAALYSQLRQRQPVEYGAMIHWQPGRHILSFSPELFFRVEEDATETDGENKAARRIVTKPMKGTAPRGRTTEEDRAQAAWLQNDEKNRAENLMIVDLLRNDLGRLARFGSVRVADLFAVERHPTLWQMTSTISAELRPEVTFAEIFRALFPCGSITGAPKVQAMQRIAELEARPRGVYTGAIGYIANDRAEFSVAIRTLEFEGTHGHMGVGGGIVIDSDPGSEFAECKLKARFLTEPVPEFQLIETLLWSSGFPLLELHLDRLEDSAEYFGFPFDWEEVEAALDRVVSGFADSAPRKLRLLLDHNGNLEISAEPLPQTPRDPHPVRVCIASQQTDPADAFDFHKTTHRPLYTEVFERERQRGYDEVLFFNQQGELTEGAISNVFVEKDGLWSTPPLACGLLGGVARRHLLQMRPEIEERVLTEDDLREADAVWLTNAVRGLRRAVIDWDSPLL